MQTTSQSSLKPGSLKIVAPLGGILVPLDQVPDPVFAQKMVGDGISLDPISNELLAPVAGTVTQLHNAHHALTITTPEGIEVLVHIGLDTVMLRGEGSIDVDGEETYPRGTIAMANSGQGLDGSQFFLVWGDSQLPPDYTVVGTVDDAGLAVLDVVAANGNDGSLDPSPGGGAPTVPVTVTAMTPLQ